MVEHHAPLAASPSPSPPSPTAAAAAAGSATATAVDVAAAAAAARGERRRAWSARPAGIRIVAAAGTASAPPLARTPIARCQQTRETGSSYKWPIEAWAAAE